MYLAHENYLAQTHKDIIEMSGIEFPDAEIREDGFIGLNFDEKAALKFPEFVNKSNIFNRKSVLGERLDEYQQLYDGRLDYLLKPEIIKTELFSRIRDFYVLVTLGSLLSIHRQKTGENKGISAPNIRVVNRDLGYDKKVMPVVPALIGFNDRGIVVVNHDDNSRQYRSQIDGEMHNVPLYTLGNTEGGSGKNVLARQSVISKSITGLLFD